MTQTDMKPTQAQIEAAAEAMMRDMFAPHELPLDDELRGKYLHTAKAALTAAAEAGEQELHPVHNCDCRICNPFEHATIERCAQWHDEQERLFRWRAVEQLKGPCPLPDVSNAQDQVADWHKRAAIAIRAMKDQP